MRRKPLAAKLRFDLAWREEESEGFSGSGHTLGQVIEDQAALGRKRLGRKCVVETDAGAGRQSRDITQSGAKCFRVR